MSDTKSLFYSSFTCRLAANGGWLLQHEGYDGRMTNVIGAFTSSSDLMQHLASHVTEHGLEEVTPPTPGQEGGAV